VNYHFIYLFIYKIVNHKNNQALDEADRTEMNQSI